MKRKLILKKKSGLRLPIKAKPQKKPQLPARYVNGAAIVLQHPQRGLIIEWLKEGISAAAISRYLVSNNLVEQATATFADYLLAFRKCYPELLADNPTISLDDIVSPNKPPVDVAQEVNRMYRLQKTRLAIGVRDELTTQRLSKDGHRDMAVAHTYLETLAKMDGKIPMQGSPRDDSHNFSDEVKADLLAIKKNEMQREKLRETFGLLVASFKETVKA